MTQTPLPIVSGRYFSPNAPLLCLKWMPACFVMSVKEIGPEGRDGVELDPGVKAGFVGAGDSVEAGRAGGADRDLQPAMSKRARHVARQIRDRAKGDVVPV